MNPNNPLTTKFCVFLFWVKWGRLEKPAFEIFRSGLKADLGQKKKHVSNSTCHLTTKSNGG